MPSFDVMLLIELDILYDVNIMNHEIMYINRQAELKIEEYAVKGKIDLHYVDLRYWFFEITTKKSNYDIKDTK